MLGGNRRGRFGRQQRAGLLHTLLVPRFTPRGLQHFAVEVDLRAQTERYGILGREACGVPMGAVADLADRRLRGANQAHDLAVLELGMVAQDPEHRVGAVMAARDGCVARAPFGWHRGYDDFGLGKVEFVRGIALGDCNLIARQLPRRHRVEALNALGDVTIGDTLDLKHVQPAKRGDLIERQRCIFDQPHGGGFGH